MSNDKLIEKIVEEQSLGLFRTGCESKNYSILLDLTKGKKEMKLFKIEYDLSDMPANRRINMLADVGLVERINKKKEFIITPLGKQFLKIIESMKKSLNKTIYDHILRGNT
ncbi:MAG: hypothetical protein KAT05_06750 [Spirochaetes bacterium]|nr:hypothetical protein [Spirochaetota bacterium]